MFPGIVIICTPVCAIVLQHAIRDLARFQFPDCLTSCPAVKYHNYHLWREVLVSYSILLFFFFQIFKNSKRIASSSCLIVIYFQAFAYLRLGLRLWPNTLSNQWSKKVKNNVMIWWSVTQLRYSELFIVTAFRVKNIVKETGHWATVFY